MKQATAKHGQTIFDISLERFGSIEGVFDLLAVNDWQDGIDQAILIGEQYKYEPNVLQADILQVYTEESRVPSSGIINGNIAVPDPTPSPSVFVNYLGAPLLKTGLEVSYASNDDGALQNGRSTDFFTLERNNPFGNLNRFTDENGGQNFNIIVLDWSTFNGLKLLGYSRIFTQGNWNNLMANQPYSLEGYNDWYISNLRELFNLCNYNISQPLNYTPFNKLTSTGNQVYSSTTAVGQASRALALVNDRTYRQAKGATRSGLLRREFTLNELGL